VDSSRGHDDGNVESEPDKVEKMKRANQLRLKRMKQVEESMNEARHALGKAYRGCATSIRDYDKALKTLQKMVTRWNNAIDPNEQEFLLVDVTAQSSDFLSTLQTALREQGDELTDQENDIRRTKKSFCTYKEGVKCE
jgi:flagellar biosynthesis chaperone FliJ